MISRYILSGSCREDERRRLDEDGPLNGSQQPALQMTVCHNTRLGRRTSRGEEDEQSRLALSKNQIRPLPVQDHNSKRFRRPALPFAGARRRSGWSNYEGGATARRGKTLTRLDAFWYRPTGQLYRRVPRPRVTIGSEKSGNRLRFHISQT